MSAPGNEWYHFKVFIALVAKGMEIKRLHLKRPYYVKLYPHQTNAALLYDLDRPDAPVHIHPKRVDSAFWLKIKPALRKVESADAKGFEYYSVENWNEFASSLGLD